LKRKKIKMEYKTIQNLGSLIDCFDRLLETSQFPIQFNHVESEIQKIYKAELDQSKVFVRILNELVRLLIPFKDRTLQIKSGASVTIIQKYVIKSARDKLLKRLYLGAGSVYLLDLVDMPEDNLDKYTAAETFKSKQYEVVFLDKSTVLYRAGQKGGNFLGQYFTETKPESTVQVRKTCAVKDNWDSMGITLQEIFTPKINTVFTFNLEHIPEGLVAYKGFAAPLGDFKTVDNLAKKVYVGGGMQILIIRPWELAREWPHVEEPLQVGKPWELVDDKPSDICRAAFDGTLTAHHKIDEKKANEQSKGMMGFAPLHFACMCSDPIKAETAVRRLLECKADPAAPSQQGETGGMSLTPLMIAAEVGHQAGSRESVPQMLLHAAARVRRDLDTVDSHLGRGPAHYAARRNRDHVLVDLFPNYDLEQARNRASPASMLLPHFDINRKDSRECTPLWHACRHGSADAAALLLARRADGTIRNSDGVCPLHAAVLGRHESVVGLLLAHGGGGATDSAGEAGRWPLALHLLHTAIATGSVEVARAFAVFGPAGVGLDLNMPRPSSTAGNTALHMAAQRGDARCVRALLAMPRGGGAQADPTKADKDGWTPLHVAVSKGDAGACLPYL
jgi:ankyrin repeat protein